MDRIIVQHPFVHCRRTRGAGAPLHPDGRKLAHQGRLSTPIPIFLRVVGHRRGFGSTQNLIASKHRGTASLQSHVASKHCGVASMQRSVASKHCGVASMQRSVASKHRDVASMQRSVASKHRGIASMQRSVASKHRGIASMQRSVASNHRPIASMQSFIASKHCGIASMQRSVASNHRPIASMQSFIASKHCGIASRQKPVACVRSRLPRSSLRVPHQVRSRLCGPRVTPIRRIVWDDANSARSLARRGEAEEMIHAHRAWTPCSCLSIDDATKGYSPNVSKLAFPPAAVVLIVNVRSVTKR